MTYFPIFQINYHQLNHHRSSTTTIFDSTDWNVDIALSINLRGIVLKWF